MVIDWFVEMEAKATPEEKQQSLARMEMLKQMQSDGGSTSGFSMASLFSQQRSRGLIQPLLPPRPVL
jgi:hypothetical protein